MFEGLLSGEMYMEYNGIKIMNHHIDKGG